MFFLYPFFFLLFFLSLFRESPRPILVSFIPTTVFNQQHLLAETRVRIFFVIASLIDARVPALEKKELREYLTFRGACLHSEVVFCIPTWSFVYELLQINLALPQSHTISDSGITKIYCSKAFIKHLSMLQNIFRSLT